MCITSFTTILLDRQKAKSANGCVIRRAEILTKANLSKDWSVTRLYIVGYLLEYINFEAIFIGRRVEKQPEPGTPIMKPKRMRICVDVSGR